jgi:phosphoenolpyruvate carboxylase
MDKGQGAVLSDMYQNWTFFRVTMDMLEMVFAKADPKIVKVYERHLVPKELHRMCDDLLERFKLTEECMLEVMKHPSLLSSQSTAFLQSKLQLRAPYVAPLNILQVYSLKLIREVESGKAIEDIVGEYNTDEDAMALMSRGPHANPLLAALEDTMVVTMKGVAAGMQNTG